MRQPVNNDHLANAYSSEQFRESGHRIIDLLADHLQASMQGTQNQTLPWMEPVDSLDHWRKLSDPENSTDQQLTIEELTKQLLARSVHISDPRFMGHQICSPAPDAILAGLVTDFLNNGSGVYEMGMAGTAMEKVVVRTVANLLELGDDADGIMTSGGTLANLTALLAARSCKSTGQDWNKGTHQQLALMVSEQAHYCVDRAVRIMGWGEAGIIRVPTVARFSMQTDALPGLLAEAKSHGKRVIAVVGSACTTSTGSFDNLSAIADFCDKHGLWFHVDGAHGAAVAFSKQHRHLVQGIDRADSVVIDFHKMLMTPVISSALIFKRQLDSFKSFSVEADYLFSQVESEGEATLDEFNLARRTFECTKTMLSAKIYSLLAIHGVELFEQNIDQLQTAAQQFAEIVLGEEDFELAISPQANIVCFRYSGTGQDQLARSGAALSELNVAIRERLIREGQHYIVKTTLAGETWLRCTLANPFTGETEMRSLLDSLRRLAAQWRLEAMETSGAEG